MPEILWENVSPLIADTKVSGRSAQFTFRCPVSGKTVTSSATIEADDSVGSKVATQAKRTFANELRWSVARGIRSAFGYNMVGRLVGDMVGTAVDAAVRPSVNAPSISDAQRQEAAVDAFRAVSSRFVWDSGKSRWISAEAAQQSMSSFEQQLARGPLTERYDRALLARMLVELCNADGRMSRDEEALLLDMLDADVGDAGTLARRPPLSAAELGEASPGAVRETLLMLAWSMALCDEDLQDSERGRLEAFARGLGLNAAQERGLRENAQAHVLEQVLERVARMGPFDERSRSQVQSAGSRLGMSADQSAAIEARFLKRRGLY